MTHAEPELYWGGQVYLRSWVGLCTTRKLRMPKALCMSGMAIAILVFMLFTFDLVAPETMAPFRRASVFMDVAMLVTAILLGIASWLTFREQV